MNVKDAMTANVKTIAPEASLKDAAAAFAEHGIGGAPVVDREGNIVGVLTDTDILLKERAEAPSRGFRSLLHPHEASALATKVEARTVEEAASAPAITAEAWWSVSEAAEVMLEQGVNRLPVVEGGRLVGIITRHDIVRMFARSDPEIEREIREDALRGLWSEGLELRVEDGEVTLRGEVESRYDAEALPDMIRRIPGVVGVDSELTGWDLETDRKVVVAERRP